MQIKYYDKLTLSYEEISTKWDRVTPPFNMSFALVIPKQTFWPVIFRALLPLKVLCSILLKSTIPDPPHSLHA